MGRDNTENIQNRRVTIETSFTNHYKDLAPSSNIDENNIYCDSLNWAIENEDISNIALMGAYGSGKSSIIETFIKRNFNQYKFLKLSLATFTGKCQSPKEDSDELIELSLLQQLFYQVEPGKIPNSRFKRIRIPKISSILIYSTLILWGIFSLIVIFKPNFLLNTGLKNIIETLASNYIAIAFCATYLFAATLGIFYFFISAVHKIKLSKVNLKNGEFELSKDSDPSILNKHMDEILYFFEVTDYDVVIIEDLDRFDNINLFTKLREINILINETEVNKKINKKIVFIYAIKEDLFNDVDRIKFFDFIIPVIPVINTFNAEEILLTGIKKILLSKHKDISEENINELMDTSFICDIAIFIPDMRLLTNIINEFILYSELLQDSLPKANLNNHTTHEKLL